MIFKFIVMFFAGYVNISVEGFFIEKFMNICKCRNILLQNLRLENDTYLKAKILKKDFKEIVHIAKKLKCKVKIEKRIGIPFFINKYRKRKIFVIAIFAIAIFIFIVTKFIWNIDIIGNEKISNDEILKLADENGIKVGSLKSNIDSQRICNLISMERDDIAWVGISIKGTNVTISIKEAKEIPEVIDRNEICNIIADKNATISKIIVQSGTARVSEGDVVEKGNILVEGVMEGVHTGKRFVHAEADVYGKNCYTMEKMEQFVQNETINSGKEENKIELCINNFKINFNKGVSKFKNYDTIIANKKVRFFSNYYFPVEIKMIKNIELQMHERVYTENELKEKIINELEDEFEKQYNISKYDSEDIQRNEEITNLDDNNGLNIKITYEIEEKIGTKVKVN